MFGSTRLVWLHVYHKKGKRITALPHSCPFPKQAATPALNEIPICNANLLKKKRGVGGEKTTQVVHAEYFPTISLKN